MARRVLMVVMVAGLGLTSAAEARAAFLSPCAKGSRLQCGRLSVPLDPAGKVKATVSLASLAVRRIHAQASRTL